MKLLSFFLFTVVFAAALLTGKLDNGFAKTQTDPKTLELSVIDPEQANKLFKEFASDKDIPFKYPIDGCYARASEMSKIAENEGVTFAKIYASGMLQVQNDSSRLYPVVRWGWHVAPVVYVKDKSGNTTLMVFDPSLFDKPVTQDEWLNKMKAKVENIQGRVDEVYYGARFQYFARRSEGNKTEWKIEDLASVRETFDRYRPLQDSGVPWALKAHTQSPQQQKKTAPQGAAQ